MTTAAELIGIINEGGKRAPSDDVASGADELVTVPGFDRTVRGRVVARYFRMKQARLKALETELEVIKLALREKGQELFEYHAGCGQYVGTVDFGGTKVGRANKYAAVRVEPSKLKEFVGGSNYRLMFNHSLTITFADGEAGRRFVNDCNEAGITVGGKIAEKVSGTKDLARHIIRIRGDVDEDVMAVLRSCARDQSPRVGGK